MSICHAQIVDGTNNYNIYIYIINMSKLSIDFHALCSSRLRFTLDRSRLLPCSQCMHGAVRAYIPQSAHQAGEGWWRSSVAEGALAAWTMDQTQDIWKHQRSFWRLQDTWAPWGFSTSILGHCRAVRFEGANERQRSPLGITIHVDVWVLHSRF